MGGNGSRSQENGGLTSGAARTADSAVGSVAGAAGGAAANTGAVAGSSASAVGAIPANAHVGLNSNSHGVIGIGDVRLVGIIRPTAAIVPKAIAADNFG